MIASVSFFLTLIILFSTTQYLYKVITNYHKDDASYKKWRKKIQTWRKNRSYLAFEYILLLCLSFLYLLIALWTCFKVSSLFDGY